MVPLPAPVGGDVALALDRHLHDVDLQADLVEAELLLARALAAEDDLVLAGVAHAAVLLEAVPADAARSLRLGSEGRVTRGRGSLLLAVGIGDLDGYPKVS